MLRRFAISGLVAVLPLSALAQGYSTPNRSSGYPTQSQAGASTSPQGVARSSTPNSATGQGRSEGAFGMTPQLQRELGIPIQR